MTKEIYKSEKFLILEEDANTDIGTPRKDVIVKRLSDGCEVKIPSKSGGLDCVLRVFMITNFGPEQANNLK